MAWRMVSQFIRMADEPIRRQRSLFHIVFPHSNCGTSPLERSVLELSAHGFKEVFNGFLEYQSMFQAHNPNMLGLVSIMVQ